MQPALSGGGGACADDNAAAIGEEGRTEGDGGVEVLADKEVAVVEGGGGDGDTDVVGTRSGRGDVGELEGVVDLAGLAVGLSDSKGSGHGERCGARLEQLGQSIRISSVGA